MIVDIAKIVSSPLFAVALPLAFILIIQPLFLKKKPASNISPDEIIYKYQ